MNAYLVTLICQVLGVNRNGFYRYLQGMGRPPAAVKVLFADSRGTYGSLQFVRALPAQDYAVGRYQVGGDVVQDTVKASEWFQKAAEQGHIKAQLMFGSMYMVNEHFRNEESREDYAMAIAWISLAAEEDEEDAIEIKGHLAIQLTPTQLSEAESLLQEYRERYGIHDSDGNQLPDTTTDDDDGGGEGTTAA